MDAWLQIFEFQNISDQDVDEIRCDIHSPSSDRARAAILKIYTYETDLYPKLNEAGQTKDLSKLKTLGPYAYLLNLSLFEPPKKAK